MRVLAPIFAMLLCALPAESAQAQAPAPAANGGAQYGAQPPATPAPPLPGAAQPIVAGRKAALLPDGTAAAPAEAPPEVQAAVWAANGIQDKPYRYGGGHRSFTDSGYDCSGTVSFALKAANLVKTPLDSSSFMSWGASGPGQWVTIYTEPSHAYMVVAGLRFDTSGASGRGGSRWTREMRESGGYTVRHPAGL